MKINIAEAKTAFLEADLIDPNEYYIVNVELRTNLSSPDAQLQWGLYGTPKGLEETLWGHGETFEAALSQYREKAEKLIGKAKLGKFVEA